MGRLEDELAKIASEMESLDAARLSYGPERDEHLHELIEAIHRGRDLSRFDPDEVERMRQILERIGPAAERVLARLAEKGGHIGEDGSWRPL